MKRVFGPEIEQADLARAKKYLEGVNLPIFDLD